MVLHQTTKRKFLYDFSHSKGIVAAAADLSVAVASVIVLWDFVKSQLPKRHFVICDLISDNVVDAYFAVISLQ